KAAIGAPDPAIEDDNEWPAAPKHPRGKLQAAGILEAKVWRNVTDLDRAVGRARSTQVRDRAPKGLADLGRIVPRRCAPFKASLEIVEPGLKPHTLNSDW